MTIINPDRASTANRSGSDCLSSGERNALSRCEGVIERGIKSFVETGAALMTIRDSRLYRETHATFKAYCVDRWGLSDKHAYRYIDGARVCALVSAPLPERAARELAPLIEVPDELLNVWRRASGLAVGLPTASLIAHARRIHEGASQAIDTRYVYFIQSTHGGLIKIGVAEDIDVRLAAMQRMCPVPLRVLGQVPDGGQEHEQRLHAHFAAARRHGEWFEPVPELTDYISTHAVPAPAVTQPEKEAA